MQVIRSAYGKFFTDGIKLGVEHPGIDALMTKQTRTLAVRYMYIHNEEHFIDNFLDKCPSGRYRTMVLGAETVF